MCDGRRDHPTLAVEWPRVDFGELASDAGAMWGAARERCGLNVGRAGRAGGVAERDGVDRVHAARAASLPLWLRSRPERRMTRS